MKTVSSPHVVVLYTDDDTSLQYLVAFIDALYYLYLNNRIQRFVSSQNIHNLRRSILEYSLSIIHWTKKVNLDDFVFPIKSRIKFLGHWESRKSHLYPRAHIDKTIREYRCALSKRRNLNYLLLALCISRQQSPCLRSRSTCTLDAHSISHSNHETYTYVVLDQFDVSTSVSQSFISQIVCKM